MSQTPIYDQLCSERINTDVSARHRDQNSPTHLDRHQQATAPSAARRGATLAGQDRSRVVPPLAGVIPSPISLSANDLDADPPAQRAAAMPPEQHARTTPRHHGHLSITAASHPPPTTAGASTGEHVPAPPNRPDLYLAAALRRLRPGDPVCGLMAPRPLARRPAPPRERS